MINKFLRLKENFGLLFFLKVFLSPFTVIITMPFMTLKLLWNCKCLLHGSFEKYLRFSGIPASNCFFYWTQALNLDRHGREGISTTVGSGNVKLSNWFHLSSISHKLFWRMSVVVTLVSFIFFALSHLFWSIEQDSSFSVFVTVIIFFSSLLYSSIDRVNYNSLGWMFFPLFIWALNGELFLISGFVGFLIGLFSMTVSLYAIFVTIGFYLRVFDPSFILSVVPLLLVNLKQVVPIFMDRGKINFSVNAFINIAKQIGILKKNVKYKRTKSLSLVCLYFSLLFGFYILVGFNRSPSSKEEFILYLAVFFLLLLFLGQTGIFRFADSHSYYLSTWSVLAVHTIISEDFAMLLCFLFISNPIPALGLFYAEKPSVFSVPFRKPINVDPAISIVQEFFKEVKKGEKVLFQFENPRGRYEKIFDGYRNIFELFLFVGNKGGLHVFPDWYFIAENNFEEGLEVWGRKLTDVFDAKSKIEFNYFIAYETRHNKLDADYALDSRIEKMAFLDVSTLRDIFTPDPPHGLRANPLLLTLYRILK
tara:strand:+ start:5453 stop:7057 length:1605 start_codon:yes stop_codon:yes gene_type:complete